MPLLLEQFVENLIRSGLLSAEEGAGTKPKGSQKREETFRSPAVAPFDAATANKHQEAWADYLGLPVETTNSLGMRLVLIPPGEFDMGLTQAEIDQELSIIEE
jgi:formylglycine-generating enzyme required for sulfatase activity